MADEIQNAIDIDDLVSGRRPFKVVWMEQTIEGEYDPNAYDETFAMEFRKYVQLPNDNPESLKIADKTILAFVTRWNLTRAGEMLPVTADSLKQLKAWPLRDRIAGAIIKDIFDTESAAPKSSENSSSDSVDAIRETTPPTQLGEVHPRGSSFSPVRVA